MNIMKSIDEVRSEFGATTIQENIDEFLWQVLMQWAELKMAGEEGYEGTYMGFFCVQWICG